MSKDNNLSARISKCVLILLVLDDKKNPDLNHRQIASALNTSLATIVATVRDYFQNGLDYAITHHYNPASVRSCKINVELKAHISQLALQLYYITTTIIPNSEYRGNREA